MFPYENRTFRVFQSLIGEPSIAGIPAKTQPKVSQILCALIQYILPRFAQSKRDYHYIAYQYNSKNMPMESKIVIKASGLNLFGDQSPYGDQLVMGYVLKLDCYQPVSVNRQ